jgi:hypothetical protein
MYPHERSLVKKLADKPFVLLGVNSDSDRKELKTVLEKEKITWRSFWDGGTTSGPIATRWAVEAWPTLYVIDHKGVVRKRYEGSPGEDVLNDVLDEMIKEAEGGAGKKPAREGGTTRKPSR